MATLLDTDFEDYAVGQGDLLANGWNDPTGLNTQIVSTPTHGGTRALGIGHLGGGVSTAYRSGINDGQQRSLTIDCWVYKETPPSGLGRGFRLSAWNFAAGNSAVAGFQNALAGIVGNQTTVRVFNADTILSAVQAPIQFDVWQHVRMEMVFSTVNDAGDDVNADGCIRGYLDGVQVINVSGVQVYGDDSTWASGINSYDTVEISIEGYFDDIVINDDPAACISGELPPVPPGTPCCGDTLPDPRVPNAGPPRPPALQPWERNCLGGGAVPSEYDLEDAEDWAV